MWVADERKDEYLEAGHRLASSCVKPTVKEEPEEETVVKPKRTRKKK